MSLLTASAACREKSRGPELHVIWESDVPTLDPNERFEFVSDTIAMNVFEPLVRYDRQMAFTAGLATSWEIQEGAVWRFRLREGVKFQDGSPFSAADVAFSIARVKARPDRDIHRYVSAISEVRVVDPFTIDVRSERPAGLLSVLSFIYILPKATVERLGDEAFFQAPSGTGPYRIAEWRKGQSLRLEANDGYWGGRPVAKAAVFRVVPGEDAMWTEALRLSPAIVFSPTRTAWAAHRDDKQFRLVERPGLAVHYLVLQSLRGRLRTPSPTSASGGPFGQRSTTPVSSPPSPARELFLPASSCRPPSSGSTPAFRSQRSFREQHAGCSRSPDSGRRRRSGSSPWPAAARSAVSSSRPSAPRVSRFARNRSVSEEFERRSTACDADLFLSGWICATGDAGELFEGNFYSSGSRGHACGYGSAEMDAAVEEIGRTLDPAARRDLLQQTMKRLVDDLPWIPLIVSYDRHALTSGVEWDTRADGQLDLRDVRLK